LDGAEVLQNQAFLEPPENEGVAPQWSAVATQIAITETPFKEESASNPARSNRMFMRVA
jgi:hypothetical protein